MNDLLYKLEITTKIGCKNNCKYCPQDKLITNYSSNDIKEFTVKNFEICIKHLHHPARIHFSGMCEPFLNSNCSKMIELCYNYNYKVGIYSTLIGASIDDVQVFKNRFVEPFMIHIPNKNYMNIKDEDIDNWCIIFNELVKVNSTFGIVSLDGNIDKRIMNVINKTEKSITIPHIYNRAGNLNVVEYKKGKIRCRDNRFYQNVLLPNGNVVLCCNDFSQKHIIGNLICNTLADILNSQKYIDIFNAMDDESLPLLCRNCEASHNV